ncbi:aldose 1-epimerase family protein [Cyclobacterium xiamenense]|uniref:aldose 1-epimerase family protein n=1 Tax=Cyclobacterium xiamenense TaxID=1297121 RepID=UPI0012BA2898|nr:aldose 1-epimerase family protein [Cyclobacterium xiamenense]
MNATQSFQLKKGPIEARFSSQGAECTSLSLRGLEYLWQANPSIWGRHAPVLFPIVGRLRSDQYSYQGKSYPLSQHGFARDRNFSVLEQSTDRLVFTLESDEQSLSVYPFAFALQIAYELTETGMHVTYRVRNPDPEADLWYSIGAHPGFNCPLEPKIESLEDYQLDFGQPNLSSLSLYTLENGLIGRKKEAVSLNAGKLDLHWELFQNDALIFDVGPVTSLSVRSRKTGRGYGMEFAEFCWLGLWTKQRNAGFLCLEPWNGIADAWDHDGQLQNKRGMQLLSPGGVQEVGFGLTLFD